IRAFLPPSSSNTGLSVSDAAFITARPVGTLPISAVIATSGWLERTWPTSRPPGTTFHTPGGKMPSISSASRSADRGACPRAVVTAFGASDHRQLVAVLALHVGDLAQHLGALGRRHPPPFMERSLGGRDRGLGIGHGAVGDLAERFTGGRIGHLDVAAPLLP